MKTYQTPEMDWIKIDLVDILTASENGMKNEETGDGPDHDLGKD